MDLQKARALLASLRTLRAQADQNPWKPKGSVAIGTDAAGAADVVTFGDPDLASLTKAGLRPVDQHNRDWVLAFHTSGILDQFEQALDELEGRTPAKPKASKAKPAKKAAAK